MPHSEIATKGIVQDALKSGKEVFIPHIHRDSPQSNVSVMDMLSLNSLEEFESLNPDKWGIPSLSDEHIPNKPNCFGGYGVSARSTKTPGDGAGLDLVVMPGMAFDADLKRLGHGKGYYDNFLSRYWKEMERSTDTPRMPFLGEIPTHANPGRNFA
jgi:5-formyltetrahydrofolate cyclo-ligase